MRLKPENTAWNFPEFRRWWENYGYLNPDINPEKISVRGHKMLKYKDESGEIREISVYRAAHGPYKKVPIKYFAWSYPEFREFFREDLNPGIDPTKLRTRDYHTFIRYITDGGRNSRISVKSFFQKLRQGPKTYSPDQFCWNYPEFREMFSRELNPGMDPEKLKVFDKRSMKYRTADGDIDTIAIRNMFDGVKDSEGQRSMKPPLRWRKKGIKPAKRPTMRKKGVQDQYREKIHSDPKFWEYYDGERTEEAEEEAARNWKEGGVKMRCRKGHSFRLTLRTFYSHYDEPCPFCDGRQYADLDAEKAAEVDPEILLFLDDKDCDPYKLSPRSLQGPYHFKCPYCGYEFNTRMLFIVGKHPKCGMCLDTGKPRNENDDGRGMEPGVPFLTM